MGACPPYPARVNPSTPAKSTPRSQPLPPQRSKPSSCAVQHGDAARIQGSSRSASSHHLVRGKLHVHFLYRLLHFPEGQDSHSALNQVSQRLRQLIIRSGKEKLAFVFAQFQSRNSCQIPKPRLNMRPPFAQPLQVHRSRQCPCKHHFFQTPAANKSAFFHDPDRSAKTFQFR